MRVSEQCFRCNDRNRIFSDKASRRLVQVHNDTYFFTRTAGQIDPVDCSLMNSTKADIGTIIQTGDILEVGPKPISGTEEKLLASDKEHSGSKDQHRYDNENPQAQSGPHRLFFRHRITS